MKKTAFNACPVRVCSYQKVRSLLALVLAAPGALLAAPPEPGAERALQPGGDWTLSRDGTLVIDQRAGLARARCAEGMRWTGSGCAGQPLLLGRAEAGALAAERWKAQDIAWRLPRAAELQRLVDKSRNPPGLRADLFPAAPGGWHWSATANASGRRGNPYNYNQIVQGQASTAQMELINGWAVNLSTGEARGDAARSSRLPLRLVRPAAGVDEGP